MGLCLFVEETVLLLFLSYFIKLSASHLFQFKVREHGVSTFSNHGHIHMSCVISHQKLINFYLKYTFSCSIMGSLNHNFTYPADGKITSNLLTFMASLHLIGFVNCLLLRMCFYWFHYLS